MVTTSGPWRGAMRERPDERTPTSARPAGPARGESRGGPRDGDSEDRGSGRLILVVDDNRDGADLFSMVLRLHGYRVTTAYDGPGALEAAGESPPSVAILDLAMPGMDGFELARRIRAQPWGEGVRLIARTGWSGDECRRRSLEAGFQHFLIKPVPLDVLFAAIEGLQDSTRGSRVEYF
jgi:CheY-like chemotaxis protein